MASRRRDSRLVPLTCVLLLLVLMLQVVDAALVRVSPTGTDATSCGTSASPCATFRFALERVAARGDTIELAAGMYTDTGATIAFSTASGLRDVTITAAAGTTPRAVTIDRAYAGRLFTFAVGAGKIRITGIRFFRGGWADADGSKDYSGAFMQVNAPDEDIAFTDCIFEASRNPNKGYGGRGGVGAVLSGAPQFINCLFTSNWAGVASAIHSSGTSAPVFDGCTFEHSGCYAGGWGGVVVPEDQSAGVWRNSVFWNNSCDYGGAVDDGGSATPLFENCTFDSNFAGAFGGVYYGFGNTQTRFIGCRFFRSRIAKGGVGQDFYLSSSVSTTFERCEFDTGPDPQLISDGASGAAKDNSTLTMIGCSARGYRAALGVYLLSVEARGYFESSVFSDNECVRGGAIMVTSKPVVIKNCTFVRNVATEGGAVMLAPISPLMNTITDCRFVDNVAKNTGGAIKANAQATATITGCTFTGNSARGTGGGALYVMSEATVIVNASQFENNFASSGGAIWSEGKLTATHSAFRHNYLYVDEESAGDACGVAAGTGGAIYSAFAAEVQLTESTTSPAATVCTMAQLQLQNLVLERNNASAGSGGAIFLDQHVPRCVTKREHACTNCSFVSNDAAFGSDVGTIVRTLELVSKSVPTTWALMTANDVVVGARDQLGQALAGAHTPLLVRVKVLTRTSAESSANASAPVATAAALTSNASRTLRGGDATFKALMLRLSASEVVNTVDRPLALSFTSDSGVSPSAGSASSGAMTLLVPIVLARCPESNDGLLNADGSCLIEATGGTDKVIAGVIFSVVVGGSFIFMLYWSYKHSNRVMKTLQDLVTGVGGIVIKFFFELLDIASDAQALVNLFLFDVSLSHPTFVRVAYVTCFTLSILPSALLVHATVQNIRAQWKRTKMRKIFARRRGHRSADASGANTSSMTDNSVVSTHDDEDTKAPAAPSGRRSSVSVAVGSLAAALGWTNSAKVVCAVDGNGNGGPKSSATETATNTTDMDPETARAVAEREDEGTQQSTRKLVDDYIKHEIRTCEHELEYYRTRATLMKRVLARVVTEDLLLLALNIYIYLSNHSDETFLRSKFRSSLEFSMLMSAVNFGSQAQTIVTWLQINKVGEIRSNLQTLKKLKARIERTTKRLSVSAVAPSASVKPGAAGPWVSPVKKLQAQQLQQQAATQYGGPTADNVDEHVPTTDMVIEHTV